MLLDAGNLNLLDDGEELDDDDDNSDDREEEEEEDEEGEARGPALARKVCIRHTMTISSIKFTIPAAESSLPLAIF